MGLDSTTVPDWRDLVQHLTVAIFVTEVDGRAFTTTSWSTFKRSSRYSFINGNVLLQRLRNNFDVPGGELRVFCSREPGDDFSRDLDDVLAAKAVGERSNLRMLFGPKDNLGDPVAIAKVYENDAAVVRRESTQPQRVTRVPASALRKAPQWFVR